MGRCRPSFLSDSGTKMRGVVRAMAGGHTHIIIKKEEALIVTTAAFSKATKCPAGLCASGELCVQYRRFLTLSLIILVRGWLSDLWPQLQNVQHRLTFRGKKITSGLAPLDEGVLFSGISSLPPCYYTFNVLNPAGLP